MNDSSFSQKAHPSIAKAILVFWLLLAFESAIAFLYLIFIPGDAKNAILLGFSVQRLLMMAVLLAALAGSIIAVVRGEPVLPKILNAPVSAQRAYFAVFLVLALACWQVSFLADYQLGRYLAYYQRLQPLLFWGTLLAIQAGLLLAAARIILTESEVKRSLRPRFLTAFAISATGFLLFWLFVLVTGLGIGEGNNYWNKAGVPLLGIQIIAAAGLGIFYFFLEKHNRLARLVEKKPWLIDLILVVLFWSFSALCWASIPIAASRFNTQPLPPNFSSYPYSDAMDYVLSAGRIMQGKNLMYYYADKPLHIVFLVIIQLLGGTDFNNVILTQTILLAIMPALVYLLGKSILNRMAGVMAGLLAVFYQVNAIQSTNLIQVSNVKMMLSEPLTAVGILTLCLLTVRWLKTTKNWWENLMLAAGAVGIGSLIRLNAATMGLVLLLAAAIQLRWQWKKAAWAAVVAAVFFTLALTPWIIRNSVVADNPIVFLKTKIHGVIWRGRLRQYFQTTQAAPLAVGESAAAAELPVEDDDENGLKTLLYSVTSNYTHNLVGTFLMVPPVLRQGDIFYTIREPYWDIGWDGSFTRGGILLLIFNTCIVSVGVAGAWTKRRMAGIVPLLALLAYHITSAISVVSGGRYIVAVDWVIYFYLALGLAEVASFILRLFQAGEREPEAALVEEPPAFRFRMKPLIPVVAGLLLVGSIPWAVEEAFPEKYPERAIDLILQDFGQFAELNGSIATLEEIRQFLEQPEAVLLEGQAFFPRFYQPGQGDTGGSGSPFSSKGYPHFAFVLQGQGRMDVNMYLEETPAFFPNGIDVMVLGCEENGFLEALVISPLSPGQTLIRPDMRELKCLLTGPE
jgi:hypothetical protein